MRKVILPKGMLSMFKALGSKLSTKRKDFYYFPFWVSVDRASGETNLHGLDDLPLELQQQIVSFRETLDVQKED